MREYDQIFSLGASCACTMALRDVGLQQVSWPLDWAASPGLVRAIEMIENGFEHWFDREDLELWDVRLQQGGVQRVYRNRRTDFGFPHEFTNASPIEKSYSAEREKYDRRIARFYDCMSRQKKVLAIYLEVATRLRQPDETLKDVRERLERKFPGVSFDLVYIFERPDAATPVIVSERGGVTCVAAHYGEFLDGAPMHTVSRGGIMRFFHENFTLRGHDVAAEKRERDRKEKLERQKQWGKGRIERWVNRKLFKTLMRLKDYLVAQELIPGDRPCWFEESDRRWPHGDAGVRDEAAIYIDDERLAARLKAACAESHRHPKAGPLGMRVLHNAVFDPARGLYVDGQMLPQTFWVAQNGRRLAKLHAEGEFTASVEVRQHLTRKAYYLGIIHSCWGHCLLDCTRFLWPIVLGRLADDVELVYSLAQDPGSPEPEDMVSNFRALLECAGVDPRRLRRIRESTAFESLVLADEAFAYDEASPAGHTFTPEGAEMFQRLGERAGAVSGVPFRTVYLSRSHWRHNAVEFGEERVERAFRRCTGCEIVSPERLSFRQMVRLLSETKKLITTEGSLAHNAVFLPPGAEIVLLLKGEDYNRYQPMVNEMRGLRVTYVCANTSDRHYDRQHWRGPFFLHVTKSLAEYLHCDPEWPKWIRFRYLLHVFWNRCLRKVRF